MGRATERLHQVCEAVRPVEATPRNAARLHRLYQEAYLSDERLLAAVDGDPARHPSVNGMTERVEADRLLQLLAWPGTLALEVPSATDPDDAPQAFVLNHYADTSQQAIREFKTFMLSEVFQRDGLQFESRAAEQEAEEAFDRGNLLYFGEFVSLESPVNTHALLLESYRRVVLERLGVKVAGVIGKCLEQVHVGQRLNANGNVRIKRIARSIGLKRIGLQVETRPLSNPGEAGGVAGYSHLHEEESPQAELTFGFYLGDTRPFGDRLAKRGYV
jgi:hypothetical protein